MLCSTLTPRFWIFAVAFLVFWNKVCSDETVELLIKFNQMLACSWVSRAHLRPAAPWLVYKYKLVFGLSFLATAAVCCHSEQSQWGFWQHPLCDQFHLATATNHFGWFSGEYKSFPLIERFPTISTISTYSDRLVPRCFFFLYWNEDQNLLNESPCSVEDVLTF